MAAEVYHIDSQPKLEPAELDAFKCVARGTATSAQQKWVMAAILSKLCGVGAIEPAKLSDREGGFLAGKRFVGILMAKWSGINLWSATETDGNDDG